MVLISFLKALIRVGDRLRSEYAHGLCLMRAARRADRSPNRLEIARETRPFGASGLGRCRAIPRPRSPSRSLIEI